LKQRVCFWGKCAGADSPQHAASSDFFLFFFVCFGASFGLYDAFAWSAMALASNLRDREHIEWKHAQCLAEFFRIETLML